MALKYQRHLMNWPHLCPVGNFELIAWGKWGVRLNPLIMKWLQMFRVVLSYTRKTFYQIFFILWRGNKCKIKLHVNRSN